MSRDVTDQKRTEEQTRLAQTRAMEAVVTPVIRVHRGVLLVPLIAHLDASTRRR